MKGNSKRKEVRDMGTEDCNGQMDLTSKATGWKEKQTVEGYSRLLKEIFWKVNGKKIRQQDWGCSNKKMVRVCSRDTLETMPKTEEVSNYGVMEATIMESTAMGRSMERVCTTGLMVPSTLVNGSRMKCTAQESLSGLMVVSTKDSSIWE